MINSYKDLTVWQKSIQLVKEVYKITEKFPSKERFGLTSQIRRSVVAIPSNIAEGFCRRNVGEYRQFLHIAFGSGAELETQLLIAKELDLLSGRDYLRAESLLTEVMKMLNAMITKIRRTTTSR